MTLPIHPGNLPLRPGLAGVLLAAALALPVSSAAEVPPELAPPDAVRHFLEDHCLSCHDTTAKGGLNLEDLAFSADEALHAAWVRVHDRVLAGEMPPPEKPRPAAGEKEAFVAALSRHLEAQHRQSRGATLRRLNRTEYQNTLHDAFGAWVDVRAILPEDPVVHGFDNLGTALGLSESQFQRYLDAAGLAIDDLRTATPALDGKAAAYSLPNHRIGSSKPGPLRGSEREKIWLERPDGAIVLFNGASHISADIRDFRAPAHGTYAVRIEGYAYQSREPVRAVLRGGHFNSPGAYPPVVGLLEYGTQPRTVEVRTFLRAGSQLRIVPELALNHKLMQDQGPAGYDGPGLAIGRIEIQGPLDAASPVPGQKLFFGPLLETARPTRGRRPLLEASSTRPSQDAATILADFASAAFRRPVSSQETAPFLALFEKESASGEPFTSALRTACSAILCSPQFLFLIEPPGPLDDHALASRLAYFLHRGPPDEPLRRLAAQGRLRQPAVLRQETERLLRDPKSARFITDFTDAWLNLRDIEFTTPDPRLYPEFNASLQESMLRETRAFFHELIAANLPASNIVRSDFAMLNGRLAQHYGIPGVEGAEIRRVRLPLDSPRGGVLSQAGVLKVSANGVNTSPVIRGVFVLERILGIYPSPPPPGTPGIEPDIRGATTLQEMLIKHRESPQCQSCHTLIDPPGFALEQFDVIGGWRERFRTLGEGEKVPGSLNGRPIAYRLHQPVHTAATLRDGTPFEGYRDFQDALLRQPLPVHQSLTTKLLTFATGRPMGFSDRSEIEAIARQNLQRGGVRDLLHAIVQSRIFQEK